ncbi:MAG: AAA family ATPase [Pseudomonadota bacterium]
MFDGFEDDGDVPDLNTAHTVPASAPLTSFGTPRTTFFLRGHEDVEQNLLQRAVENRLPQALLITGPEGVGKATLAFRLARFLLSGRGQAAEDAGPSLFGDDPLPAVLPTTLDVPADDPAVHLITATAHPDLMVIEREVNAEKGTQKASIGAGQIRGIADLLHLRPATENGWRVIIIDDADTMTIEAQNSLLKMLEEPPPRTLIMLIAHRQGQLLPTIYSRVQKVRMDHISREDCLSVLTHDGNWSQISTEMQNICIILGNRTPGQILRLLPVIQADGLSLLLDDMQKFDHNPPAHMPTLIERAGGQQGADMPMYTLFERLLLRMAHLATVQGHHNSRPAANLPPVLQTMYDRLRQRQTPGSLLKTYDQLDSVFSKTRQQNLDRRASVATALSIWRGNG